MPLESPVGFLTTLEETVATARRTSGPLEAVFTTPVLLVVAPMEPWVEVTAVRTAVRPTEEDESSVTMMPTLVFRIERRSASSNGPIHFGRGNGDVVMPFAAMSKSHGQFVEKNGEWFVSDTGSKNGTYVNGEKCSANAVLPLRDKATLRFGDVSARFLLPSSFCQDLRRRLSPS